MASLVQLMAVNYHELVNDPALNPIVNSWFLMSSPIPLVVILACYLYFVLSAGPKYMASRKPYNLQTLMVVYNGYQVLFSIWLFSLPFRYGILNHFAQKGCKPFGPTPLSVAVTEGAWWYFFSKVIELLDTVFFVLRKKQNQVTFLHVYHHTITAFFSWGYLKFIPGEQGVVVGTLNSAVHIFMYFYYMVSAMGPKYQKYIWWKKYMTWIQLGQFCLMLTYLLSLLAFDCKLSKALTFFFVVNASVFLYLFAQFYRTAYHKKAKPPQQNGTHLESKDAKTNGYHLSNGGDAHKFENGISSNNANNIKKID